MENERLNRQESTDAYVSSTLRVFSLTVLMGGDRK